MPSPSSPSPWPGSSAAWKSYAARCTAFYPLMATDWEQHTEIMKTRRNREIAEALNAVPDEPPLTPEEEEGLQAPAPDTLF